MAGTIKYTTKYEEQGLKGKHPQSTTIPCYPDVIPPEKRCYALILNRKEEEVMNLPPWDAVNK